MAFLCGIDRAEFTTLRGRLGLTDGNRVRDALGDVQRLLELRADRVPQANLLVRPGGSSHPSR